MQTKEKNGISLIVLIITIVVIIILAAAVILTINKNNPIESAKKATFVNDLSAYQDELTMYIGNKYIEAQGAFYIASLDGKALEEVITINSKYNEKFAIKDGKIVGTDKLSDQEKEWAENITGGNTGNVTPPVPQVPSNYTDVDGKKAYIPTGFTVSTVESEKKIDTGLVIKDGKGNEFVWIPVEYTDEADFATKFVRKQGYKGGSLQINYPYAGFVEPYNGANKREKDEYNAMVDSVKKYYGYYIARYEASNDGSGNAQSKPNVTPWVNIKWSYISGGAVEKAIAMYPVESASEGSAVSTLCYGVQWDMCIDYIENYGVKNTTYRKDSTGKGNYDVSVLINTGSNASYALNNIYDLAGNVWEWTMEAYTSGERVFRGGSCYYSFVDSSIQYPVSYRRYYNSDGSGNTIGFRVALYLK